MTFQTVVTEFAEFMGTEIKRIEKKIPTSSSGQSSDSTIITGNGRPDKPETTQGKITGREANGTFYNPFIVLSLPQISPDSSAIC